MSTKNARNNEHQYAYNAIGEMLSHITPRNNNYIYEYDGNRNLLYETNHLNGVVEYTYNVFDEVTSVKMQTTT